MITSLVFHIIFKESYSPFIKTAQRLKKIQVENACNSFCELLFLLNLLTINLLSPSCQPVPSTGFSLSAHQRAEISQVRPAVSQVEAKACLRNATPACLPTVMSTTCLLCKFLLFFFFFPKLQLSHLLQEVLPSASGPLTEHTLIFHLIHSTCFPSRICCVAPSPQDCRVFFTTRL